jgi:HsdM N-terminal domain
MTRDQLKKLERDLWSAADKLRANSDLKASEYSTPVLGLIFLKFADNKYRQYEDAILAEYSKLKGTRRERSLQDIAIEKCGCRKHATPSSRASSPASSKSITSTSACPPRCGKPPPPDAKPPPDPLRLFRLLRMLRAN